MGSYWGLLAARCVVWQRACCRYCAFAAEVVDMRQACACLLTGQAGLRRSMDGNAEMWQAAVGMFRPHHAAAAVHLGAAHSGL